MEEVKKFLKDLNSMTPLKASDKRSTFETKVENTTRILLGGSIFFSLISWVLVLSVYITRNKLDVIAELGIFSSFISVVLAVLSMLSPIILFIRFFRRAKQIYHEDFMNEIEYDEENIRLIKSYPVEVIEYAGRWIEIKLKRMERRIGLIFGPNTAAFAIAAIMLKVMEGLGGPDLILNIFKDGITIGNFGDWLFAMAFGTILGLSLGALWLRTFIDRYQYQLDLITMCLDKERSLSSP